MNDSNKIAIAMSGGVDSSVAASIIKEKGYQAVGISLQLWNYSDSDNRFGTCCSPVSYTHLTLPTILLV